MADSTTRLIVVPIIKDPNGRVLICKMASDRGVFPGQWGLPGGGVEAGERIEEALHREVSEELGVSIQKIKPLTLLGYDLNTQTQDTFAKLGLM